MEEYLRYWFDNGMKLWAFAPSYLQYRIAIIEFIILDYLQMIINIDLVELEDLPWLTYYKTLSSLPQ